MEEQARLAEVMAAKKKKQPLVKGKANKIFDSANYELSKNDNHAK